MNFSFSSSGKSSGRGCGALGMPLGGIFVLGSLFLLQWNEGRAVKTEMGLKEAESVTVPIEAGELVPANEGKVVHVSGKASTEELLTDAEFQVAAQALRLRRVVEMYQWREEKHETKEGDKVRTSYSYRREWSPRPIDSSAFEDDQRRNPPFPIQGEEFAAPRVTLGAFRLSSSQVDRLDRWENLPVDDEAWRRLPEELRKKMLLAEGRFYLPASSSAAASGEPEGDPAAGSVPGVEPPPTGDPGGPPRGAPRGDASGDPADSAGDPPPAAGAGDPPAGDPPVGDPEREEPVREAPAGEAPAGEAPAGEAPATTEGEPASGGAPRRENAEPELGDLRIGFEVVYPLEISLVSVQRGDSFEPYRTQVGTQVDLLQLGVHSPEAMYQQAHQFNNFLTWVLRGVGWFVSFLGFLMFFAPLARMAEFVPLLGKLVGTGVLLISFGLSAAISLTTIALAWVFYRPVLGITLLVLAVVIIVGFIWLIRSRNRRPAKG